MSLNAEMVGMRVSRTYERYQLIYCGYHDDKHASAIFWRESGDFFCNACKTKKSWHKLLEEQGLLGEYGHLGGQDFYASFNLITDVLPGAREQFVPVDEDEMAVAYCNGRGIETQTLLRYDVRYSDRYEEIVFKSGDKDEWVGRRIRSGDGPRYIVHGLKPAGWPYHFNYGEWPRIVLSEGPFKAMMIAQVCGEETLSISSMGSSPPLQFWQKMAQCSDKLILVADDDYPGRKFAAECKRRLGIRAFLPKQPFDEVSVERAAEMWRSIDTKSKKLGGF